MRKSFWEGFCLAVLLCVGAWALFAPAFLPATVTLTTPFSQAGPNVTPETDNYAAPMGICADQVQQRITITLYPINSQAVNGSNNVTSVAAGTIPPVTVTLNTSTGVWSASNGLGGTLAGSALTGAQGWLAAALTPAMKNQAEQWMMTGVLPGTQPTPWQQ